MSVDTIETLHGSLIQHGPHNNRIYVMHLNTTDVPGLLASLDALARQKGYGKIFAKIPAPVRPLFSAAGYVEEAMVPNLFNGRTNGFFMAKYVLAERQMISPADERLQDAFAREKDLVNPVSRTETADINVVACRPSDAGEMSVFYRQTFRSYPFPIHQADYLNRMIAEGVRYFCIRLAGGIAAMAAAEIDAGAENVEMTDFATQPEWRSKGLAGRLLRHMETTVAEKGIKTAYTITRAGSEGMNRVFLCRGYQYAGWLTNNTQIGGKIESMIVWYKPLENTRHKKTVHQR
jgi:putative beta-lysine N-acetyltransferase